MLLVAGAACDGSVWRCVVERFSDCYQLHVLSLAGFAGRPPIDEPLLATARRELGDYCDQQRLSRLVVVGHSLGAFFCYALAADHADRVAAAIAVDGVPALGQLLVPGGSRAEIERAASARHHWMAQQSVAAFAEFVATTFGTMVVRADRARPLVHQAAQSDPRTVADAMYELWTTDLRPILPAIKAPLLYVAPGAQQLGQRRRQRRLEQYRAQLAPIARHSLVVIERARHFVMLDEPQALLRQMERFLGSLP